MHPRSQAWLVADEPGAATTGPQIEFAVFVGKLEFEVAERNFFANQSKRSITVTTIERRTIRYSHLREAVEDARNLASRGYERCGKWSLEQNLNHLNKTMNLAFEPVDWRLPRLVRPLLRWLVLGRMERLGSRALPRSAKAPGWLQPDDSLELDAQIGEFDRLTQLIESSDAQLTPDHPVFGRINRAQWQIVTRWHCAHHLSHLLPRTG